MSLTEQQQASLRERLKRLGYGRNSQIRLYGSKFDVISDPIVVADRLVFLDAVEQSSGRSRRLRIPLTLLSMLSR